MREAAAQRMPEVATAVAMIHNNIFVPLMFKLVMTINKPAHPMRVFKSKEKALVWLASYKLEEATQVS